MTTNTSNDIDPELGEVTITRDFDAPRELIWNAFFDPEQFVCFWGPVGTHTPLESVIIEPWVGGRLITTMVADDGSGEYPTSAVFTEVREPDLFAFTEPDVGMVTTSTLTDLGNGRTRLVIHQTNVPAMYRTDEAVAGFKTSLDRLDAYLRRL